MLVGLFMVKLTLTYEGWRLGRYATQGDQPLPVEFYATTHHKPSRL